MCEVLWSLTNCNGVTTSAISTAYYQWCGYSRAHTGSTGVVSRVRVCQRGEGEGGLVGQSRLSDV